MPTDAKKPQPDPAWQKIQETGAIDGRKVYFYQKTESTNTMAMKLGEKGVRSGTVVIAEEQSLGRGRLGRKWLSPAGAGLYFSMILRPELAPEELSKVTLAAGAGVCRALELETGLAPQIKWPNDIVLDNKKLGGILTETGPFQHDKATLIILGIGLNVGTRKSDFPENLRDQATSLLAAANLYYSRSLLLSAILEQVENSLRHLQTGNFKIILEQLRARDATLGRTMAWLNPHGQVVTGRSLGIDERGLLHIKDAQGLIHEVLSGDISLAQG